jgi:hypothetical protein
MHRLTGLRNSCWTDHDKVKRLEQHEGRKQTNVQNPESEIELKSKKPSRLPSDTQQTSGAGSTPERLQQSVEKREEKKTTKVAHIPLIPFWSRHSDGTQPFFSLLFCLGCKIILTLLDTALPQLLKPSDSE